QWCREDYGRREHGTTGVAPMEAFEVERLTLKALPAERFQAPEWKQVSVHGGDQFLTFNGIGRSTTRHGAPSGSAHRGGPAGVGQGTRSRGTAFMEFEMRSAGKAA
ncbi:MAG: hypothetical protein NTU88_10815, partial [Armatimonadetes bacterium]|nr:hypothetical protein [Armatimonadota bacterium]